MSVIDDRLARLEDGQGATRERLAALETRVDAHHDAEMAAIQRLADDVAKLSKATPPPPPPARWRSPPDVLTMGKWGAALAALFSPVLAGTAIGVLGYYGFEPAHAEPPHVIEQAQHAPAPSGDLPAADAPATVP